MLLKRGADGGPALLLQAGSGNQAMVRLLLDSGVDVNSRSRIDGVRHLGDTALIVAADDNKTDMVSLLLNRGADPNVVEPGGSNMATALMFAAYHCNKDMARMLLDHGASTTANHREGMGTAYDLAHTGWTSTMNACSGEMQDLLRSAGRR